MTEPAGSTRNPSINSFLESVGELLVTAVEMAHTRLELVFLELQQGIESLVGVVLWALIALIAGGMGLLFGGLALIFVFWDTHRVLVASLLMAAFLLCAAIAAGVVRGKLREQRSLFATTLTELSKDRGFLKAPP
jgi:uncharacterized membrane protein YqjE